MQMVTFQTSIDKEECQGTKHQMQGKGVPIGFFLEQNDRHLGVEAMQIDEQCLSSSNSDEDTLKTDS